MKKLALILILIPLGVGLAEQKKHSRKTAPAAPPSQTTAQPAAQSAAPSPAQPANPPSGQAEAPKIPAGATQIEPYLFSYTDPQGKKWIYRQTPFGVVKWEDKPVSAAPVVDNSNPVVVTDLGDSVRFSYSTPFGVQKRVVKKSELTDDEKELWKREQDKGGSAAKTPEKP